MRPLVVLIFLLPLIVLYEVGSVLYLADASTGVVETIRAKSMLDHFFGEFGMVGVYLPGVALVAVLLTWHLLNHDRWRVRLSTLVGMGGESIAWTAPLLMIAVLVQHAMMQPQAQVVVGAGQVLAGATDLQAMGWQARLTISLGAGLYEEMLFRMIVILGVHFLLVDLLHFSDRTGKLLALVVSAVSFALYHDLSAAGSGLGWGKAVFYVASGLYFGGLYLLRGLGIVVAVHAIYDVVVLVALNPDA